MKIDSEETLEYQIRISDVSGRVIYQTSTIVEQGVNRVLIPTMHLSVGLYSVMVSSDKGSEVFKLEKVK